MCRTTWKRVEEGERGRGIGRGVGGVQVGRLARRRMEVVVGLEVSCSCQVNWWAKFEICNLFL